MRNPKRVVTIIARLKTIWSRNTELRLGQLLINALPFDFYYMEDGELIGKLEDFYAYSKKVDGRK